MDLENQTEKTQSEKNHPKNKKKWYVLQVLTGSEYKVQTHIDQILDENKKVKSRLFRILIPEEETIEIKNNKKTTRRSKIYPGYIFLEAIMDDVLIYHLQQVIHVGKVIGIGQTPLPVLEDDILKVLQKAGDTPKRIAVEYKLSETVKVTAGPFRGYSGTVNEINDEQGKVKILISIFGRETPVELGFDQVENIV